MAADPTSGLLDVSPAPETSKSLSPRRLITDGIRNRSTREISRGLELDRSLLPFALSSAVTKGSVPLTSYLLATERASLDTLTPLCVATEPSIELLDVVVSMGWDINQRSPDKGAGKGQRLLDLVIGDEGLVRWCLEHGAQISDGADEEDTFKYSPLTESVAGLGTVSSFKLLRENNARIGQRTLHRAAEGAATCNAAEKPERMAMLRFLVEEERLNVNQMDTDEQLPNHWGTPIAYAAKGKDGVNVVTWLLERGADPTIKDCWGIHDALSLAKRFGNEEVAQVLRESMKGTERALRLAKR